VEAFNERRIVRVVLTGSECTGKSTLAAALAQHYGIDFVPEFVRDFAERLGRPIDFSDHGAIARGQMALEDEHQARGTGLIIQDTDLLSTVVYCQHYFGRCPAWIEEAAAERRPVLYLLCEMDVPWIADGIRDRSHARAEMQALFASAVEESGVTSIRIRGDRGARTALAIAAIERFANAI
jgi:NadR type nicotinamide-nucleotide adenylyltransferase